jgi:hypothetical protein
LVWRAAAGGDPATPPPLSGPQRLKQDVRIIVDTNAPPVGTGTNHAHKALRLRASWRGWDGLHLELDQRTPLANPTNLFSGFLAGSNAPVPIHLQQVQMTAQIGGRLNLLMAGVNWYLSPHVRWMFNYGMGRVSGGLWDGDMFSFQTRLGVDF